MHHDLQQTISLLTRTPAALNALLRDLPDPWILQNEGENTWTVFGVVEHLAYAERTNWLPRAKYILEFGETQPFKPFTRLADNPANSLPEALDVFARLRSENLSELQALNLQPNDLERRGQHPTFGPVTLAQLLATWASHDLTHLHQISRILAHQYREAVGPWSAFLGVLKCDGHSTP